MVVVRMFELAGVIVMQKSRIQLLNMLNFYYLSPFGGESNWMRFVQLTMLNMQASMSNCEVHIIVGIRVLIT